MYRAEHVVIRPANLAYVWVALAKEHCRAMVLRVSSPMPQRGSRKCGTLGEWFSEPPNKELAEHRSSMDAQIYNAAIEYELLARTIYEAILTKEGLQNNSVQHNASIWGRSGALHQIDIYWKFCIGGIDHIVHVECKNYGSNLTLEKARSFFAVLHDIGNCRGIIITKTGFQSGVVEFCRYYGIDLKIFRKPTDNDWNRRAKEFHINFWISVPLADKYHSPTCNLYIQAVSEAQSDRLNEALKRTPEIGSPSPSMRFLNQNWQPITDEMRWWIPQVIDVTGKESGGPYQQNIKLQDHYISADLGEGLELVKCIGVVLNFHVERKLYDELVYDASSVVEAVLIDQASGRWEHIHTTS